MTPADLDAVTALDRRAFGESAWSRRYFEGELLDSPISLLCVLCESDSGRVIGYFGVWHIVDQLQLCTFAIEPSLHRRGLGKLLLECVVRLAQRLECGVIQLEVWESNTAARNLYRGRGFHDDAVRRNFYDHPKEDGILMSMATPSEPAVIQGVELTLEWDDRAGRAIGR